ncbi:cation:proton antiporter [Spirulina sp. CS-785/01]|uniref:cation:proton antiporter n=1 Tax=Spirulina sp. CS-785/01 TaxID=3021716 RepID=UPI00232CFB7A|nr:sodium:proton antiporter [Spirulina sp. CS-785/01]MDB9311521.1 cation:proton antiporter [Spirulina sp. CS-785/01]
MEGSFYLTLQIVLAVLAGISAQVMGELLKVPSIVFLLLLGILLGSDGLNVLHPHELGVGLEVLVALAVAIILFEGGLNLELRDLGRVSGSLQRLVTLGTLITLAGGGMAAHWLSEFPWSIAFLYASLVVVTGPTVIGPLLKQVSVNRQVATILEGEGVLIDPVGAILAVVVLDTILNSDAVTLEMLSSVLLRLGIGAIIGIVGGWLLGQLLKRANFLSEDLKNLVVLAGVWGLFGLAQFLRGESGLMATVVAGIVLRASSLPQERMLRRFKGQLTVLGVSVLFILLAADLSIDSVFALGWGSVLTVLTLMLLVRPLSVMVCTLNSGLNWRQKMFIAWVAPKGIISASVASLFAILLTEQGINGGDAIKALVFLTIMMTVFIEGLSARWVAKWLKITSSEATGAIIVGCNPLGRLIGRLIQEEGESVVMIDTDTGACEQARNDNLEVVESSGLDPDVLEEVGTDSIGTFLAVTNNGEVNTVLAQHALEEFEPPRVLAVLPQTKQNKSEKQNKQEKQNKSNQGTESAGSSNKSKIAKAIFPKNKQNQGETKAEKPSKSNGTQSGTATSKIASAFVSSVPVKVWNQYLAEGQVKLGKTVLKESGLAFQKAHLEALIRAGELLPLLVKRRKGLQVVKATEQWQAGDLVIYLLHDPRPKLLKRLSGGTSSSRLALETLPEVEEVPLVSAVSEQRKS